jgi:hypothetical protein
MKTSALREAEQAGNTPCPTTTKRAEISLSPAPEAMQRTAVITV